MPYHVNPPLPDRTRNAAQRLRVALTDAERKLWFQLRNSRLGGMKFRRQHPIPPHVVDFVCLSAVIVIELDGSQHGEERDSARTRFLEAKGFKIIRFWDNEVLQNLDAVLEAILRSVENRILTPCPSPDGRGEKSEALP